MKIKTKYFPNNNSTSNFINFSSNFNNQYYYFSKTKDNNYNCNKLTQFVYLIYNDIKQSINDHSSKYSNHLHTDPALFTILCLKLYLKTTYRKICDIVALSSEIRNIIKIKKIPYFTTLQKFFEKITYKIYKQIK